MTDHSLHLPESTPSPEDIALIQQYNLVDQLLSLRTHDLVETTVQQIVENFAVTKTDPRFFRILAKDLDRQFPQHRERTKAVQEIVHALKKEELHTHLTAVTA